MARTVSLSLVAVASLSVSVHAQLLSSWRAPAVDDGTGIDNFVSSWLTDVETGGFLNVPSIGSSNALAADNAQGLVFASGGSSIATLADAGEGEFVALSSVTVRDVNGVAALSGQVESLGFADGVLYASVFRSSGDERRRRGIARGFYRIDPVTAVATLIPAASGLPALKGMDINDADGRAYAVVGNNNAQSIISFDLATFTVTTLAVVPASAYANQSLSFDGVAAGGGKVFLTHGIGTNYANLPIVVFNLETGAFEAGLPTPPRTAENRFYPSGATFISTPADDTADAASAQDGAQDGASDADAQAPIDLFGLFDLLDTAGGN